VDAPRQEPGPDHRHGEDDRAGHVPAPRRGLLRVKSRRPPARCRKDGSSSSSADSAETMMIACSECELPIHGIRMKLVTSEPAIAPTVLAA
jgi:hypothetical protein